MSELKLVFDLDDTLYPERDFAIGGFRAAARYAERAFGIAPGLDRRMTDLLDAGHLGAAFAMSLGDVHPDYSKNDLARLLDAYRTHAPDIALFADAAAALKRYAASGALGLVTDGDEAVQRAKVSALGIGKRFAHIIYTGAFGGRDFFKPHPRGFEVVARAIGDPGDRFVYVGDNPAKDFKAPNAMGWTTVMIRRPGVPRIHAAAEAIDGGHPQHVIASLDELPAVLGS